MIRWMVHVSAFVLCLVLLTSCSQHRRVAKKALPEHPVEAAQATVPPVIEKYAKLLGVPGSELKNLRLYEFVDAWMGTPYSYAGSTNKGIDCSGFAGTLYREVYKKDLPRTASDMAKAGINLGKTGLEEGDLVFFDINGKKGSHVGVYLHNNRFVHASSSRGVIISDLDMDYYKKTFSHGGRF